MSTCVSHGTLTVSVDLEHDHVRVGIAEQRAFDEVASQLVAIFARHKIPATWAVTDPVVSADRARIDLSRGGHEMALLGDASWVGREAGRARFARELARRVARAGADGLSIRSLALRAALPTEHCDLAIKEGIVAVRLPLVAPTRATRRMQPQPVRFGLWGFPVSTALPGTSRWLPGGGGTRWAKYEIDKAIADRGLVHLAIDAPQLAERGSGALRVVERVIQHAGRRKQSGLLHVATIGLVAGRMAQENQGQPSRSILRPAA